MARSAPKKKKVVLMPYAVLALVLCALRCAEDDHRLSYLVQSSIASASSSMPVSPLLVCHPRSCRASRRVPRFAPSFNLGCIAVC